jgi:hypothetical protein
VPCHGRCAAKNEGGFLAPHAAIDPEFDASVAGARELELRPGVRLVVTA